MNFTTLFFVFPGDLATPTGGYRYDRRLIRELRQLGVEVKTIALSSQFPFPDKQALEDARQKLAAVPDGAVVIFDGLAFGTLDQLAEAEAQRLRIIALCHHPLALESGLDPAQQKRFQASEQRALYTVRSTLVTSEHTRQILIDQFALPPEKVVVAQPGTDPAPFAPCIGSPPQLLTVASLTRRKAHDVLIDALAPLAELPWQARFVGGKEFDPDWSEALQQQVNRLQLQDRIQLVIAARAGAVPDVVPESAGLLVLPDDTAALTDALRTLLTEENLRHQLQAGARRAAANLPTWADTAGRVARLVQAIHP